MEEGLNGVNNQPSKRPRNYGVFLLSTAKKED